MWNMVGTLVAFAVVVGGGVAAFTRLENRVAAIEMEVEELKSRVANNLVFPKNSIIFIVGPEACPDGWGVGGRHAIEVEDRFYDNISLYQDVNISDGGDSRTNYNMIGLYSCIKGL